MYVSAKNIEEQVDELIDYCEESGEPPTGFIVRRVTGIGEAELESLRSRGGKFRAALERLDEYRTYFWLKRALEDPRWASFSSFNLRQSSNGGFSDKPVQDTGVTVRLELGGVGEEAFK